MTREHITLYIHTHIKYLTGEELRSLLLSHLKININNFEIHSFLQKTNHNPLRAGCLDWTIHFHNHLVIVISLSLLNKKELAKIINVSLTQRHAYNLRICICFDLGILVRAEALYIYM